MTATLATLKPPRGHMQEKILKADFYRKNGRYDEALRLASEVLNEQKENPHALYLSAVCLIQTGKHGLAYPIIRRFLEKEPSVPHGWNNLGKCAHDLHDLDEAERCFRKSIRIQPEDYMALYNLGLMYLNKADPKRCIDYCEQALKIAPDFDQAKFALGMAELMLRKWVPGWEHYEASAGNHADRQERVYRDETRWDGSKGKTVVVFGEQGIGDEINFASVLPDMAKDCKKVIYECDARLEGLFRRSFPQIDVHGTRYKPEIDWADKLNDVDARIPLASLTKFYRKTDDSFPGTPFIVADPERRLQWRALLDSLGPKLKVGISWKGGLNATGKKYRSISLDSLEPVLRQDATFVSLQYRDPTEEIAEFYDKSGVKIHHWARAAEARDYDETAALVAELDCVISVTTSVIHLSGGLGKECLVLTPSLPTWRYGLEGNLPWYNSVELIRQKDKSWLDPIHEAAYRLRNRINGGQLLCKSSERNRIAA